MMMTKAGLIAAVAALAGGSAFAMGTAASQNLAVKDARITTQIRHTLTRDMPDSVYQVNISTEGDGVVVLSGRTETVASEAKAVQDAWRVPGVTAVESHLQVAS